MDNNTAQIQNKTALVEQNTRSNGPTVDIFFEQQVIENFSGPAVLINELHQIVHKNIHADNIITAIKKQSPALYGLIIRCLNNNCPDNQKFTFEDETGTRHYDLFAFPVDAKNKDHGSMVLIFGKDTTVEQHLTKALVESRQMFKDLVSCSTDFAWETDNKGHFKYVSPNGILGYTAYELNDRSAVDLIVGRDGINPFDTLDAINDVEIWLQRSDNSLACVQVSASPIIDNNSTWQGARGVCRDVTLIREREASLRRIQKSERILKKIISTIRDEIDPSKILHTTAAAALDGISAKHCYVLSLSSSDTENYLTELKGQSGNINDRNIFDDIKNLITSICNKPHQPEPTTLVEERISDHCVLISFSEHHNIINGAIVLVNEPHKKPWNKDDKSLFSGIASHLGIALEQIRNYEELEKLSRTDELTSLYNRRAFIEKINKRLIIQKRQQHTCALLYVDLDNFKLINDTFGHAKGDEILQELSSILLKTTREEDFCSRLGGDEFAIWLEDVDEKSTLSKAENILSNTQKLQKIANDENHPLSMSIGIALSYPDKNLSLSELMEIADKALYKVKHNGKAGIMLNQTKDL